MSFKRGGTMSRIVVNPEILAGKPIIEGTRLSVEHVLGLLTAACLTHRLLKNTRN